MGTSISLFRIRSRAESVMARFRRNWISAWSLRSAVEGRSALGSCKVVSVVIALTRASSYLPLYGHGRFPAPLGDDHSIARLDTCLPILLYQSSYNYDLDYKSVYTRTYAPPQNIGRHSVGQDHLLYRSLPVILEINCNDYIETTRFIFLTMQGPFSKCPKYFFFSHRGLINLDWMIWKEMRQIP